MYYAIDIEGLQFEDTTLNGVIQKVKEEGSYLSSMEDALERGEINIFKGTKVKVICIPARYEEVVEPKKAPAKKAGTKKTPAKKVSR